LLNLLPSQPLLYGRNDGRGKDPNVSLTKSLLAGTAFFLYLILVSNLFVHPIR